MPQEDNTLHTKVAMLERDVEQFQGLFDRLDSTIEKLTDVSQSIKQLLAVHEQRIDQQEVKSDSIVQMVNKEVDRLCKMLEDLDKKQDSQFRSLNERLNKFEKTKWIIVGAAVGAGLIMSKMDLSKLLAFLH
jgi:predicted RNase H-like nuclease (RuvC/YqgF family)